MALNDRKKQILKSIVDAYIESGEPVGSKYLTSFGHMSLSPATVRNEMSELEKMGYLDKPHTSAGRIPSTQAYKLYVEGLMEDYRLNLEELTLLDDIMHFKMNELDSIVEKASRIMSEVTNYVSIAMTEKQSFETVDRFDAVMIDKKSFLLVMIMSGGEIKSRHIKTDLTLDADAVSLIKTVTNDHLAKLSAHEIPVTTVMKMESELGIYWSAASDIVRAVCKSLEENTEGDMKIGGLSNLLSYPEFSDIDKLHKLMKTFDEKQNIYSMFGEQNGEDQKGIEPINAGNGLKIYIGDDNENGAFSDTSFVFCTLPVENTHAVFGIMGPKRMDYGKVVSSLKQIVGNMEKMLHDKNGGGNGGTKDE